MVYRSNMHGRRENPSIRIVPTLLGAALIAALPLVGCGGQPLVVETLPAAPSAVTVAPGRQLYRIKDGIKVSNTAAVTPKAWQRASVFCRTLGKNPREEQATQQWPPVRDFIFSCVPVPERDAR
jgi:hypothetical protein